VRKLFWKLPATRYAWALKLDSSVCCTPGIKSSNFTRMSIVSFPAGGLSLDHTRWVRSQKNYFLPKEVLQEVFRGKFTRRSSRPSVMVCSNLHGDLALLAQPKIFAAWLRPLFRQDWVVYLKRPFGGPEYVLQYLGRYTHRVAISNHRLISFADGQVTFRWRDSAHNNEQKPKTLSLDKFLCRFLLHILPQGFVRIRNFGSSPTDGVPLSYRFAFTFSARNNRRKPNKTSPSTQDSSELWRCPKCAGPMKVIERLTAAQIQLRSPPAVTVAA
jgi:Putative transposase.